MTPSSTRLDGIALIGCGAIAESFFLPALEQRRALRDRLVLVDRDPRRLEAIATRIGGCETFTDYRAALPLVGAAIVATPPELHHPIALDCLKAGVHVLCEKPLASSPDEARELVARAASDRLVLAVNNTRRLFPSSSRIQKLLASGALGRPLAIDYFEGQPFAWPTASGFYFRAGPNPRGVLLDRGAHVLDLLCWWLGGRPSVVSSRNDSFGGPEAEAHLGLLYDGCRIDVRFSWLVQQANRLRIRCENGAIESDIYEWRRLRVRTGTGPFETLRLPSQAAVFADFGPLLLDNFLAASRGEATIAVPGAAVIDSLELIDDCYASAERFSLPWYDNFPAQEHA